MSSFHKPGGFAGGIPAAILRDNPPLPAGVSFEDWYELDGSRRIPLFEDDLVQENIGKGLERRCAICQRNASELSFKKQAHVLPRSTGNRWLVTSRECDECNETYGKAHDNELINMLLPLLALQKIPGRGGAPKFKHHGKKSELGGEDEFGRVILRVFEDDKSIRVENIQEHSLDIVVDHTGWNPTAALKSIARSGWHIASDHLQKNHDYIRKWIVGEVEIKPLCYHLLHFPGPGFSHLYLDVWKRKEAVPAPTLLVQLVVGSTSIIASLPEPSESSPTYWPMPCQPLTPVAPFHAKGSRWTVHKDGRTKRGPVRIPVQFDSKTGFHAETLQGGDETSDCEKIDAANVIEDSTAEYPPVPVKIRAEDANGSIEITTLLATKVERWKTESPNKNETVKNGEFMTITLTISGADLGGTIVFRTREGGNLDLVFHPSLDLVGALQAKATLNLMEKLVAGGAFSMMSTNNDPILLTPNKASSLPEWNKDQADMSLEILDALIAITGKTGVEIRFPRLFDPKLRDAIIIIGKLVTDGAAYFKLAGRETELTTVVLTDKGMLERVLAAVEIPVDVITKEHNEGITVMGKTLDVGRWVEGVGCLCNTTEKEQQDGLRQSLAKEGSVKVSVTITHRCVALCDPNASA